MSEFMAVACDIGTVPRSRAAQLMHSDVGAKPLSVRSIPGGLIAIVPVPGMAARRAYLLRLWQQLNRARLTQDPITVAGSGSWGNRASEAAATLQAQQTLAVGTWLLGGGRSLLVEDLGAFAFMIGRPPDHLEYFCRAALKSLTDLSLDRQQVLLKTMDAYLRTRCNLADASRALNVHRNTVRQRLARVTKLTGLDLQDAESRLVLQSAIMAQQVLHAMAAHRLNRTARLDMLTPAESGLPRPSSRPTRLVS